MDAGKAGATGTHKTITLSLRAQAWVWRPSLAAQGSPYSVGMSSGRLYLSISRHKFWEMGCCQKVHMFVKFLNVHFALFRCSPKGK